MVIARSLGLFLFAGLCEIGGAYLVWEWLREGKGLLVGVAGAVVLVLYGVVQTFQVANFGRAFAAYGGIFIALSLIWGYSVDRKPVDHIDILGGLICLAGAAVIMFWPRT